MTEDSNDAAGTVSMNPEGEAEYFRELEEHRRLIHEGIDRSIDQWIDQKIDQKIDQRIKQRIDDRIYSVWD